MRLALRWHLLTLVVLAVVPSMLVSAWMGERLREGQRTTLEQALREATRAIAISIEREMGESIETLQALALDPALARGDLRALYHHAKALVTAEGRWHYITLADASGRTLFNAAFAFGSPLVPIADRDYFQRVLQTRQPVVSDIDFDVAAERAAVRVAVPVVHGSQLEFVIVGSLRPMAWASVVASQQIRPDWIVSISDGARRYIARSRDGDHVIGRALPGGLVRAFDGSSSGFGRFPVLEGDDAYVVWYPVQGTRWNVALGTAAEPFDAAGRHLALATTGAGAIFGIVGAIVALIVAGRIRAGVRILARSAAAIGRGEQPEALDSGVAELNEVGAALTTAGRQRAEADSALRGAEERARIHAEQAEEATRAKDRFLAMLSHELRTPLHAILSWTQVLSSAELDADARRRAMETIDRNARLQVKLIDDLLDVSRIVTGNLRLERSPIAIGRVVAGAVDTMRPAAALKRIDLVQHLDPACGTVDGDHMRLEQIVSNLLANAIKFTPEGGRVTIGLVSEGEQAVITVNDTGEGIDPDFLPFVFDRFRQAEHTIGRSAGGLGLGLAIVRYLVEAHGGSASAASAGRGQGSTFTVRLPLCGCVASRPELTACGSPAP